MYENIRKFLQMETASGILLIAAAILALIMSNSPLSGIYDLLIEVPVQVRIGELDLNKPLLLWINDGLMAVFFFLMGLELKREILEGELSRAENLILPSLGAIGGMVAPALVYVYINYGDPVAMRGWAIPAATDMAFALAVLKLLGDRVPVSLKVFLVSLAILDDIGAILIIALFYTADLSGTALLTAAAGILVLAYMNRRGVCDLSPYVLVGILIWVAVLKSGVHATLAGVVLAMFIPMRDPQNKDRSPVIQLEHDLHTPVAFVILPIFAFANSGISFQGASLDFLLHPVPLGIALGLVVGKQVGIVGCCWLGVKLGWTQLPAHSNWGSFYGVSTLCGIGFTMGLFIGMLAFGSEDAALLFDERLGIIVGSLISGLMGYAILHRSLPREPAPDVNPDPNDG